MAKNTSSIHIVLQKTKAVMQRTINQGRKRRSIGVHDFSARPFRRGPFLLQFGALGLTQTLTLNNWTVKEHQIGAETVCAEKDRQRNRWRRNGRDEKTWSRQLAAPITGGRLSDKGFQDALNAHSEWEKCLLSRYIAGFLWCDILLYYALHIQERIGKFKAINSQ